MRLKPSVKLIYSILINAIFLSVALFVFVPFFEEIDDTHIAMISEGAYGVREWHLIYTNVILGKLYVLLNTVFPAIRWHIVLQYMFVFLANVFLTYVLLKHKHGVIMSLAVLLSTMYELYVSIQYTKSASFVCVVGLLLVCQYVRNIKRLRRLDLAITHTGKTARNIKVLKTENVFFLIFSFIFIIYGSLLRKESFFIACVPFVFLGFLELCRTQRILDYVKIFVPLFILVFAGIFYDSYVYSHDAEWDHFMKYNKARMELTDYRYDLLDHKTYPVELSELAVTENDAAMILTYQFGDDNIFSYERFRTIRDAFPKHKKITDRVFRNLYGNVRDEVTKPNVYLYALLCFAIILIVSIVVDRSKSNADYISESRAKCIAMILMGLLCAAALFYFHYSGRWSHRLVSSLVLPAIVVIAYMIDNEFLENNTGQTIVFAGNKKELTMNLLIGTAVILIGLNIFMYFVSRNAYYAYYTDDLNSRAMETIESIRSDNSVTEYMPDDGESEEDYTPGSFERLYIADTFTFQNVFKYDIFNTYSTGELRNFVTCGSWFMNSPITKGVTERFSYANPFSAMLSLSDNVILLDEMWVDSKLDFLHEHYGDIYAFEETDAIIGVKNYVVRQSDFER